MLNILNEMPSKLLDLDATDLHCHLNGPTLIHLSGRRQQPLFVSVLLHGNEDTGWHAIKALLKKYLGKELPRSMSIFIGNVSAARHSMRRLDRQPDYNRVWNDGDTAEHAMMQEVLEAMRARDVFASVDIHNSTGLNPHYACINWLEPQFFQLATLFSRTVVYFINPQGVQSEAFGRICPAITLECGQPGYTRGVEHATDFLHACLNLSSIPDHSVPDGDIDLFHTVAIVKVPAQHSFGFEDEVTDICFLQDLDRMNFMELPVHTVLARVKNVNNVRLEVMDEHGLDVGEQFFEYANNEIRLKKTVMPALLTRDVQIIRQDCLCYLMERFNMLI